MSRFRNLIHTSIFSIRSSTTCKPSHRRPFYHMPISHFTTSTKTTPSTLPDLFSSNSSVLGPTEPNEKPRIVVMGSGWAGCSLMKAIDTNVYDIVCVSTRNHMVFTPLLVSTCVGTLEFRSVAIPLHRIQPVIDSTPGSYFFPARCTTIDTDDHVAETHISPVLEKRLIVSWRRICCNPLANWFNHQ